MTARCFVTAFFAGIYLFFGVLPQAGAGDIETAGLYSPVFLDVELPHVKGDPNRSDDALLDAVVTTPSGRDLRVPGFCVSNRRSGSMWQVRFTPLETGSYEYYMEYFVDGKLSLSTGSRSLHVTASDRDGFLRVSSSNHHYLRYDTGKPFFGIGFNVAWTGGGARSYASYFKRMSANGCNMTRVWLCNWGIQVEREKLGDYDEYDAELLDAVLRYAKEYGIYIILSMDTYGRLMAEEGEWGESEWAYNPYNAENGGPCDVPYDLFTSTEAVKRYKDRARYILARWGYSPNIMAFELWNEYNAPLPWVEDMLSYLKSIDVHGHLFTTSLGYPFDSWIDEKALWSMEDMDIVTLHEYGDGKGRTPADISIETGSYIPDVYGKPVLISETSLDAARDEREYDRKGKGWELHNAIWSSAVSRLMGTSMYWWWDTYIQQRRLYEKYLPLSRFVKDVDWDSGVVRGLEAGPVKGRLFSGESADSLQIDTDPLWREGGADTFDISAKGEITGGRPGSYLHSVNREGYVSALTFNVDLPEKAEMIIRVGKVSAQADLIVEIDGEKVLYRTFLASQGDGPWKKSVRRNEHGTWEAVYDEDVEVSIPEGEHKVRLINAGLDWMTLEKITFEGHLTEDALNVRATGLQVGKNILFWIQDMDADPFARQKDILFRKGSFFEVILPREGKYGIKWFDTETGEYISRVSLDYRGGPAILEIPSFSRDIACKITYKTSE